MNFGKYIAHRGLHGNGVPENSLVAFEKGIKAGISCELDVQMTKDCRLVVFHDVSLMRMCGVEGKISDYTYEQLMAFKLGKSECIIPLLSEVLKLVDGKIKLLIEIKNGYPYGSVESRVAHMLKKYDGEYAIEAFNPFTLLWFRLHSKNTCRGQLISEYKDKDDSIFQWLGRLISSRPFVWRYLSRPCFIACDLKSVGLEKMFSAVDINADFITWTADSPELFKLASQFSKTVIGENFPKDIDLSASEEEDSDK